MASTTSPSGVGYMATECRGSSFCRDTGGGVFALDFVFFGVEAGEGAAGLLARCFVCDRSDDWDTGEVVRDREPEVGGEAIALSALDLAGPEGVSDLNGSDAVRVTGMRVGGVSSGAGEYNAVGVPLRTSAEVESGTFGVEALKPDGTDSSMPM